MKQKLLLLWSLLLCATLGAMADTSTLTFTSACGGSGTADDGVAWTVTSDGTESSYDKTKGIHYGTSSAAVQYIKLTTRGISGTISEIKVNASTASGVTASVDVTVGGAAFGGAAQPLTTTATDYTFTGSASGEIVVNVSKASSATKALYVKSVVVTFTPAAGSVSAPVISGTTPFVGSTEVTITCSTEGATVYYTTDGNAPSAESTPYAAPFNLTETTTVKAIAIKDGNSSAPAEKIFTAYELSTIADAQAAEAGTTVAIAGTVVASAASGAVIKDATDLIYYYNTSNALTVGQKVKMIGAVSSYGGANQMPNSTTIIEDGTETVTDPAATTLKEADFTALAEATTVERKFVSYTGTLSISGNYYNITIGGSAVKASLVKPKEDYSALDGQEVIVKGYQMYINTSGSTKYVYTVATSVEAVPEDIVVVPAENSDIYAAVQTASEGKNVKDIYVYLAPGKKFTISKSIVAPAAFVIMGAAEGTDPSTLDETATMAEIDASTLTGPLVQMSATPAVNANADGFYPLEDVGFINVKVTGLTQQLFYANKIKYLFKNFHVDFCNIQIAGGSGSKTTIDTNGGGVIAELDFAKNTIWANPAHTGQFYSSQSGQKATDAGLTKQVFNIERNTFYNISYKANIGTHRQANQTFFEYNINNNVFVNTGKSGQAIKGFNAAQGGSNPTWGIEGNAFNFDGADTSAAENTGDTGEPVQNSIAGVIDFIDAAAGDFSGDFLLAEGATAPASVGDPRWTINFEAYDPTVIWRNAKGVAIDWNGQDAYVKIDAAKFADAKVGDILHVAVEGVTPNSNEWSAQVGLKDGEFTDIEAGLPVGKGDVSDATFVLTGDMLAFIKATGLIVSGENYSTKKVRLESVETAAGSEKSVWVGQSTGNVSVNVNHVKNFNSKDGIKATDVIRVKATATEGHTGDKWFLLSYSGNDTGWDWKNYEGMAATAIEGGFDIVVNEDNIAELKTDGFIVNQSGYTITQVEILTADEATGINAAKVAETVGNGAWYTINGVRVAQPTQKGLYIHNGKKVVVK